MTVTLRVAPRTGRTFTGYVLVSNAELDAAEHNWAHIGLKSTAGAPTTEADFDSGQTTSKQIPGEVERVTLTRVSPGHMTGQITVGKGIAFSHAPGANVKVYAALSSGDDPSTNTFAEVSPGVLLGA